MFSAWLMLIAAGLLEVCWVLSLKYSDGLSRLWPSIFTLVALCGSILLLAKSTLVIPLATAYAVWVGIGVIGAGVLSVIIFKESMSITRIFYFALLVVSIIGLKIST